MISIESLGPCVASSCSLGTFTAFSHVVRCYCDNDAKLAVPSPDEAQIPQEWVFVLLGFFFFFTTFTTRFPPLYFLYVVEYFVVEDNSTYICNLLRFN